MLNCPWLIFLFFQLCIGYHVKAGYAALNADSNRVARDVNGSRFAFGVGAQWRLLPGMPNLLLQLAFEYYAEDARSLGLTVRHRF